jgi:hypothetical protein
MGVLKASEKVSQVLVSNAVLVCRIHAFAPAQCLFMLAVYAGSYKNPTSLAYHFFFVHCITLIHGLKAFSKHYIYQKRPLLTKDFVKMCHQTIIRYSCGHLRTQGTQNCVQVRRTGKQRAQVLQIAVPQEQKCGPCQGLDCGWFVTASGGKK